MVGIVGVSLVAGVELISLGVIFVQVGSGVGCVVLCVSFVFGFC